MDDILSQLGGLLLGAVPTVVFVVLVYGAYSALVHKPLAAVLGERYRRTEGAMRRRGRILLRRKREPLITNSVCGKLARRFSNDRKPAAGRHCRPEPLRWRKRATGRVFR